MEREFVPYNEALALKELGFDEECFSYYNTTEMLISSEFLWKNSYSNGADIVAPLYQQAFRWFREKYNMNAIVSYYGKNQYFIELLDYKGNQLVQVEEIEDNTFWTYEEAELECLKKLIEIVKDDL